MKSRIGLAAAFLGGILLVGAGLLLRTALPDDPGGLPAEPGNVELASDPRETITPPQSRSGPDLGPRSPAPEKASLTSYLRDPDGAPIAGGHVTWTPLRPEYLGVWVGWANQRWGDIEAETFHSTSDGNGCFEFSQPIPDSDGTPVVLWATHPQYLPAMSVVGAVDGEPLLPQLIEMTPGESITVTAVDSHGIPVPRAEIEQTTPIPTSSLADRFDPQARRILRRTATTDEEGKAVVGAWDGPLLLRARKGDLASEVWVGTPRPSVRLELVSTFEAGGGVTLEVGSPIEGEQRIVCQVQRGSQLQPLAVVPVVEGAWGPVTLPLLDVDAYRFRIEGWNAEVHERVLEPPAAGASMRVDFTLRAGLDVLTRVRDVELQPIPESTSTVAWDQDGIRVEARAHPGEDGYTIISGVPPGLIHVTAEAPGFVPADLGYWRIPDPEYIAYTMELVRGRRIEGRVLCRGEPVEDFELTYWPGDPSSQVTAPFRERTDGSFFLDAATTEVSMCATAQGTSPSDVMIVEQGDLPPPPLTLELGEVVRGKGRVVDAATNEPLARAVIQPFTSENLAPIAPWGPPIPVRRDGAFDCSGFSPGREMVRFSAPGYSVHWSETFGASGETIVFGLIPLGKRQDLVVRLISGIDVDFTQFTCGGQGAEFVPEQPFDRDGRVVFESMSAGRYDLLITQKDGPQFHERLVLVPEEDWTCTIPVGGPHRIRIRVDSDAALPDDAYVGITLPIPGRYPALLSRRLAPDGTAEFSSLHAGEFNVDLYSDQSPLRASRVGTIHEEDTLVEVVLDPEAASQRFRVVDSEGHAVPNAFLRLVLEDGQPPGWNADVDERGECLMRQFAPGKYRAYMQHRELGYHLGAPVDVARLTDEPIEVVFAPDRAVEIQLLDGLEPLPGVPCLLIEERGFSRLPLANSDANGLVHWPRMGAGSFRIRINQPGYWPTDAPVEPLPPGQRTQVQVRRVGDLDVSVERISGGSTSGVALDLYSLEFSASVATWIADGRVKSSTGSLTTDDQGGLSLTGLPRGLYRWALDGEEGTVEVLPGTTSRPSVLLP